MPQRIAQNIRITDEQIEVLRERRKQLDAAIQTLEMFQRQSYADLLEKLAPHIRIRDNQLVVPINAKKQLESAHEHNSHNSQQKQKAQNGRARSSTRSNAPSRPAPSTRRHTAATA